jgi:tRNA pseudouridine65 synthase
MEASMRIRAAWGSKHSAHRVMQPPSIRIRLRCLPLTPPSPNPVTFKVLYQDEHLIAIEKPSGFHVHPPEDGWPVAEGENAMRLLKQQLGGAYLWPVHRLDRPTSGVVIYGLSKEAASGFGELNRERRVVKEYMAVTRGWADDKGVVDEELDGAACTTSYKTLARAELPHPMSGFPTARLSLLSIRPEGGHYHQIRRHLNRINRPIIGDFQHGDRPHNRLMAGPAYNAPGLFLKCISMEFDHPVTRGERLVVKSPHDCWEERWRMAFRDLFGLSDGPLMI